MGIICGLDHLSHGLNQTIIEQFQGYLTPSHKINESTAGMHNKYTKFDLRVARLIAPKTNEYAL